MFVCCMEWVGVRMLCGVGRCSCVVWSGYVFVCCVEWVDVRVLCGEGRCSCVSTGYICDFLSSGIIDVWGVQLLIFLTALVY